MSTWINGTCQWLLWGQASNGLNSGTAAIYFHDFSKFLFQCRRHLLQHSVSSMALIAWSSGWGSSTPLTKTWVRTLSFETMTTGGSATAAPEGSETSWFWLYWLELNRRPCVLEVNHPITQLGCFRARRLNSIEKSCIWPLWRNKLFWGWLFQACYTTYLR